ncbi:MAG: guanylate kinase [Candidatus Omnitrophica bacterium]|nr:guanylate kinase [Candidatus Omnitrophota bacterium]
MKRKRGKIFVISSPSGGGKTSVCTRLKKTRFDIKYSVSATTRTPRKGEVNGRDYHFFLKARFKRLIKSGKFLEWADNFGDLYGTPKNFVLNNIKRSKDVILAIDVKGAMQVKKMYKKAVLTFLMPPSMDVLKKRLKKRKTEKGRGLARRLKVAKKELAYLKRYDYVVVNDSLVRAVETFKAIITAERNKVEK